MTQDVELFRASVRDNLTLFGTREAPDAELGAVLERMSLGPWFDAPARRARHRARGAQGLSAGEGQLLAFARALLSDPASWCWTRRPSRLDPLTEIRIGDAARTLLEGGPR